MEQIPETFSIKTYVSAHRGLAGEIADKCGLTTRQAVAAWTVVPPKHVLTVSKIVNQPPYILRPDIYPVPAEVAAE